MGNGKVTRHRVFVLLGAAIGVIIVAGILTGVFVAPSAVSDGADGVIRAVSEVTSVPAYLEDGIWEADPTDDTASGSAILGKTLAYAIVAFFEVVNWAVTP